MRLVSILLLALLAAGCTPNGTLTLFDSFGDDDDSAGSAADDDDVAPDDDDIAPDDDDIAPDDDDIAPDDDDIAPDDDDVVPSDCDNGPAGETASAAALASALDIGTTELVSVVGSTQAEMMAVRTGLGGLCPIIGPDVALLSTGQVSNIEAAQDFDYPGTGPDGAAGDLAELTLLLAVPPEASSMRFHFLFLTREYPEWVGGPYNDAFEAEVDGPAYAGPVARDSLGEPFSVNSPEVVPEVGVPNWLTGSGFDKDGATPWLRAAVPVAGGETLTLRFWIYDSADGIFDSAVLLDGVQFFAEGIDAPTVTQVWP